MGITNALTKVPEGQQTPWAGGLHDAMAPLRTHPGVNAAGLRAGPGRDAGLDRGFGPDAGHGAQPPPQPQLPCRSGSPWRALRMARASRSAANAWPARLARPRGGGRRSSPGWVRIFSIAARCRIAAMIFSSPAPQPARCGLRPLPVDGRAGDPVDGLLPVRRKAARRACRARPRVPVAGAQGAAGDGLSAGPRPGRGGPSARHAPVYFGGRRSRNDFTPSA
jgi:hypothetical protein